MRKPQLESRSSRYAARQNVADYETKGAEMSVEGGAAERSQGVVKFFNTDKGFGFCRRDGGLPDVFLHANALKRSGIYDAVKTGDKLEFDVTTVDGKGPKADSIVILERTPG